MSLYLIAVVECHNVKIELVNKDDSIKFNLRSAHKIGSILGTYQYKLDYDGKPVFKQSGGQERYLYWSPTTAEWMVIFHR